MADKVIEVIEVIKEFKERFHKNTVYEVGDTYPKKGFKADKKRVDELSSNSNRYNEPFLKVVKTDKPKEPKKTAKK